MQVTEIALRAKDSQLHSELRKLGRLLVAYSGGVDSAYLAWAAHRALGVDMLAVIADSPSLARMTLRACLVEQRIVRIGNRKHELPPRGRPLRIAVAQDLRLNGQGEPCARLS